MVATVTSRGGPTGSLGNRISPPTYAQTASAGGLNTVSPPHPSGTQYVLPPTATGTTVDRWGISWTPVGAGGTGMLPATGVSVLDNPVFTFGGVAFTGLLLVLIAVVVLIAVWALK